ncbi:MAG: hypothetical protein AAB693_00545 [Patescibacteria group bacterium]
MKTILALIFLLIPKIAGAHLDTFSVIILGIPFAFLFLIIPIIILHFLSHKSHSQLLFYDILIAIIYSFLTSYLIPLGFLLLKFIIIISIAIIILFIIFEIILWIKKIHGKDTSLLRKNYLHGFLIIIIIILFFRAYNYTGYLILYYTNCDTNLFTDSWRKLEKQTNCIITKSEEKTDPEFCNKLIDLHKNNLPNYCKSIVEVSLNIKLLESGDLSVCNYLKSKDHEISNFEYQDNFKKKVKSWQNTIINKCTNNLEVNKQVENF